MQLQFEHDSVENLDKGSSHRAGKLIQQRTIFGILIESKDSIKEQHKVDDEGCDVFRNSSLNNPIFNHSLKHYRIPHTLKGSIQKSLVV
uniref:Uncharacterized protein n=1 Tax=Tetranychus urticae TaxID=32264 RepID=T1KTA2_TETUR